MFVSKDDFERRVACSTWETETRVRTMRIRRAQGDHRLPQIPVDERLQSVDVLTGFYQQEDHDHGADDTG